MPEPGAPTLPKELLIRILDLTDARTRATCLRVNAAFYAACIRKTYHTVKLYANDAALPLSGPHAAELAPYVRVLDVARHPASACAAVPSTYPPPMAKLDTLRLRIGSYPYADHLHSDAGCEPGVCRIVSGLRANTLVLRDTVTEAMPGSLTNNPAKTLGDEAFSAVRHVVCVLTSGVTLESSSLFALYSVAMAAWRGPVRFTFVFWTDNRDEVWEPPRVADESADRNESWWLSLGAFNYILLAYPVTEGPLLTVVNAGAMRSGDTVADPINALSDAELRDELSPAQRAIKFEERVRADFNEKCDDLDSGESVPAHGDWDPEMRGKLDHMRFLSMDKFLEEDNGDGFDEGELAGWR